MAGENSPKSKKEKLERIKTAWKNLAPDSPFYGMTLAQFEVAVKDSFDARDIIEDLEAKMEAAIIKRDKADVISMALAEHIVDSVVADPNFGDDSALYEAMGYIRKSQRKSGLTRKKKTPGT